jgi:hypothetical protein
MRHPPKTRFQQLSVQRWFIRGSGLTKPSCSKGRKRHTAVDTFGKGAVVVTAASVPEREASKQVLSFGLPDGIKGFTAVFDRLSIEVTAAIGFSNR